MKIDCIADLHGEFPFLEGGDLLIVAGDLTVSDTQEQMDRFDSWLSSQDYKKKIFIAGNHDNSLQKEVPRKYMACAVERFEYLCDSGCEFEGLKIWGSPWTSHFVGINPHCCAFTSPDWIDSEDFLFGKWEIIPKDTDILITHSPPFGILDRTSRGQNVGSKSLLCRVADIKPQLHVFGHIHEEGGEVVHVDWSRDGSVFANASILNADYDPVHAPITVYL